MAPAYVFFASMLPLAVVSSAYLAPAVVRTPPQRAVVRMQKIEQNTAHVAHNRKRRIFDVLRSAGSRGSGGTN